MNEPILNFTISDITGFFTKILELFKQIMAWLGILVLPDEEEQKDYPGHEE